MGKQVDILQGTLDMLILKAVSLGPLHGYGILVRIQQVSKDALQVPQGSLYPALYRLEHRGWIAAEWGGSENKRKAKYYRLTAAGRKQVRNERRGEKKAVRGGGGGGGRGGGARGRGGGGGGGGGGAGGGEGVGGGGAGGGGA